MFIINVMIAFVLIYGTVGIALALLTVFGALSMRSRNPERYQEWVDERPIKNVPAYLQVVLGAILFWPLVLNEWSKS